uniref:Uncharacterized protein n=1 Tax=Anguilla anguilla TaxID=7936 RepID=A0A0E9WAR7_ANGAN
MARKDCSDFEARADVGVCLAGASMTKYVQTADNAQGTVAKVMLED